MDVSGRGGGGRGGSRTAPTGPVEGNARRSGEAGEHDVGEGRGAQNLPFAERRGRVQAKRRTQGMHETSKPTTFRPHRLHTHPLDAQGGTKGGLDRSTIVEGHDVG